MNEASIIKGNGANGIFVLRGFRLHPSLLPATSTQERRVELSFFSEDESYRFRFFDENSASSSVEGRLDALTLGPEHFLWLSDMFVHFHDTEQHRIGRFANKVRIELEVGPVVLALSPYNSRRYDRKSQRLGPKYNPDWDTLRCDFFVASSSSEDESGAAFLRNYFRFVILVPVVAAKEFGITLLEKVQELMH